MKKDFNCNYSCLDSDVICEHKVARVNPNDVKTLHNHDGYEIVLFLGGNVKFFMEYEEKQLERGDLLMVSSYSFHGIDMTDIHSYERVVINIQESFLNKISSMETNLSDCFHQISPTKLNFIHLSEKVISEFINLASKLENIITYKPYGYQVLKAAYLSEIMVLINQQTVTSTMHTYTSIMPSIVAKTFEYIEKNISTNISIHEMAVQLHHNSDYLSRSFKFVTGSSLKHYINAKRISLAQRYLREGNSPYDVCFMTGFNNYSNFSRTFSNHIGCSPKLYQVNYRSEFFKQHHIE